LGISSFGRGLRSENFEVWERHKPSLWVSGLLIQLRTGLFAEMGNGFSISGNAGPQLR